MKMQLSFIFIIVFHLFSFAQKTKVIAAGNGYCLDANWQLKFEDNFDGEQLDQTKWRNRVFSQGSLENEGVEVYCTLNNLKIEHGICKIIPKKDTIIAKAVDWQPDSLILNDGKINRRKYYTTSSWIETIQMFHYGKYEICCKVPKGKGLWPAFWMYGEKDGVNNEIDVFEFWNPQNALGKYEAKRLSMIHHMTVHYNHKMSVKNYIGPDFSQDFHTYSVIWDSTKIEWQVDGITKREVTKYLTKSGKNVECKDLKANHKYILNQVFPKDSVAIIANLAIQSEKKDRDENTFKSAFEIDYIRYYEAKND